MHPNKLADGQSVRQALIRRGVAERHIDHPWPIREGRGIFLPGGSFELTEIGDCVVALIEVHDLDGLLDVVAWDIDRGRLATLDDRASCLGEGLLDLPAPITLPIRKNVSSWLLRGRTGLVIVDPVRFRSRLAARDRVLRAEDADHAARLRRRLSFFPTIIEAHGPQAGAAA